MRSIRELFRFVSGADDLRLLQGQSSKISLPGDSLSALRVGVTCDCSAINVRAATAATCGLIVPEKERFIELERQHRPARGPGQRSRSIWWIQQFQ